MPVSRPCDITVYHIQFSQQFYLLQKVFIIPMQCSLNGKAYRPGPCWEAAARRQNKHCNFVPIWSIRPVYMDYMFIQHSAPVCGVE